MGHILNYKLWESYIYSIFEKKSGDVSKMVEEARSSESDEVKKMDGYDDVMTWFENGGPNRGKSIMDQDSMIRSMTYWNGDMMYDEDKIRILKLITSTAIKYKKSILDAQRMFFKNKKNEANIDDPISIKPETKYVEFSMGNDDVITNFFEDDKFDISSENIIRISDFIAGIKDSMSDDIEITEIAINSIASTSTVPSGINGGNEALVDLRIAAINKAATFAINNNKLSDNIKYSTEGRLPDNKGINDPSYDKAKWGKDKRESNSEVLAEYNKIFAPYRYAGLDVIVSYKDTVVNPPGEIIIRPDGTGEWSVGITWIKPQNIKKIRGGKPKKTKNFKTYKGRKCFQF